MPPTSGCAIDSTVSAPNRRRKNDATDSSSARVGRDTSGSSASRARAAAEGKGESPRDECKDLGPESGSNEKLVACLQEDRRVDVAVVD